MTGRNDFDPIQFFESPDPEPDVFFTEQYFFSIKEAANIVLD